MFCDQLEYNLLVRWFLDLNWDEPALDHSTLSRNRTRLLRHGVAGEFFRTVMAICDEIKHRYRKNPIRLRDEIYAHL